MCARARAFCISNIDSVHQIRTLTRSHTFFGVVVVAVVIVVAVCCGKRSYGMAKELLSNIEYCRHSVYFYATIR